MSLPETETSQEDVIKSTKEKVAAEQKDQQQQDHQEHQNGVNGDAAVVNGNGVNHEDEADGGAHSKHGEAPQPAARTRTTSSDHTRENGEKAAAPQEQTLAVAGEGDASKSSECESDEKKPTASEKEEEAPKHQEEEPPKHQEGVVPKHQEEVMAPKDHEVEVPKHREEVVAPKHQEEEAPKHREDEAPKHQEEVVIVAQEEREEKTPTPEKEEKLAETESGKAPDVQQDKAPEVRQEKAPEVQQEKATEVELGKTPEPLKEIEPVVVEDMTAEPPKTRTVRQEWLNQRQLSQEMKKQVEAESRPVIKKAAMSTSIDEKSVREAYEDVRSDKTDTDWAVFKFQNQNIVCSESGSGFESFRSQFADDERAFGFIRIQMGDEMSKRQKFVFLTWVGPQVSVIRRAKMSIDKAMVKNIIKNFAVELQVETLNEINVEYFREQLARAGGANYGTGFFD